MESLVGNARNGKTLVIRHILEKESITKTELGDAMLAAAQSNYIEIIDLLLKHGADVHYQADCSLRMAANCGHTEAVSLLLDYGANIHVFNDHPLQYSIAGNYMETASLLLSRGADIHAENNSILKLAFVKGNISTLKFFLDHCKDIYTHAVDFIKWAIDHNCQEAIGLIFDRLDFSDEHRMSSIRKKLTGSVYSSVNVAIEARCLSVQMEKRMGRQNTGKLKRCGAVRL